MTAIEKPIVAYKYFPNSPKFEQWQKDYPECNIIQVQPVIGAISGKFSDAGDTDFLPEVGAFVTFAYTATDNQRHSPDGGQQSG